MSFDPYSMLLSMVVSGIGFVLFKYGRGRQRVSFITTGVAMMVYPYFVDSVGIMALVFGGLLALLFAARYLGL